MVKKCAVCFLVLAFLSLVIAPDFVSAGGDMTGGAGVALAAGAAIVTGLIVGFAYLATRSSAPTEQPQEQKQEAPQSLHFQQPDEQLITPSGQIALLRW